MNATDNRPSIETLLSIRKQYTPRVKAAALARAGDEMRKILREAKHHQSVMAEWSERPEEKERGNFQALAESYGYLADDVLTALNGEFPEQQDGNGEAWKGEES